MDIQRITISLPKIQVAQLKALVEAGRAESVSGFVQRVVGKALKNDALWRETLDQMLEETGGPLTSEEIAWADSVLAGQSEYSAPTS